MISSTLAELLSIKSRVSSSSKVLLCQQMSEMSFAKHYMLMLTKTVYITEKQNPENGFKQQQKTKKKEMWYLLHKLSVCKKLKVCVRRCFVTLTLHTKTHSVGGS